MDEPGGQRRADAVARALRNQDVPGSQLQTVGQGEAFPVASNSTAAGRQQNRRVEIIFSDKDGRFTGPASG
jgi:outer membrane protein OmpA-like peptidoglycan-associated protein